MDCSTALEILESAAPSGDDLRASRLSDAVLHLQACPNCAAVFHSRQQWDRRIGHVMCDVSLPPGIKERLLEAVSWHADGFPNDDADVAPHEPVEVVTTAPEADWLVRPSRRRWLAMVAGTVAVLVAGVWGWQVLFQGNMAGIALEQLLADEDVLQGVTDPQRRGAFVGDFDARRPAGWEGVSALSLSDDPDGGLETGRLPGRNFAVYDFRLHRRAVSGVLLVLPAEWVAVADPPLPTSFGAASGAGTIPPIRGFQIAAWQEGELVYVCFVKGRGLESLADALQVTPA